MLGTMYGLLLGQQQFGTGTDPAAMARRSRAAGGLSACWLFTGFAAIILVILAWFGDGPDDDGCTFQPQLVIILSSYEQSLCRSHPTCHFADLQLKILPILPPSYPLLPFPCSCSAQGGLRSPCGGLDRD